MTLNFAFSPPLSNNADDFCFFDFETCLKDGQGDYDLKKVGATNYARHSFITVASFVIGFEKTPFVIALDGGFNSRLCWDDIPFEVQEFYTRASQGGCWFVAWNASFDVAMWNMPGGDFPPLRTSMVLDAMVQSAASGVGAGLDTAGTFLGLGKKDSGGGHMAMFSRWTKDAPDTPLKHPDAWESYKRYCAHDTALTRDIFFNTRPLPLREWQEYWTSETINNRGLAVDVQFCKRARALAQYYMQGLDEKMCEATEGVVTKTTQNTRLLSWVLAALDGLPCLESLRDSEKKAGYSLGKENVQLLLTYFSSNEAALSAEERLVWHALQIKVDAQGAAFRKIDTILRRQVEGVVYGAYVFNGAARTGRFSSRGVQVHNLPRKHLGGDEDAFIALVTSFEFPDVE